MTAWHRTECVSCRHHHTLMDSIPETLTEETLESDLILVGLVGMIDPPRPGSEERSGKLPIGGIRTVMITGDHPLTARHIASQLGISRDGKYTIGSDLDRNRQETIPGGAGFQRICPCIA